jgi:hypothetical protein
VTVRRLILSLLGCAGLALAAPSDPVAAATTFVAFQTPSHQIGCIYLRDDDQPASLRCDVRDVVDPPRRPKSCAFDYGSAFGLASTGRARRLCAGDTALDPKAKVLAYGGQRHLGPFTCTSRRTGLRCATHAGHGFELSRQQQQLF